MIYILTRKFVHHMIMSCHSSFMLIMLHDLKFMLWCRPTSIITIHHRNIGSRNTLLLKLKEEEDPGEFFLLFF